MNTLMRKPSTSGLSSVTCCLKSPAFSSAHAVRHGVAEIHRARKLRVGDAGVLLKLVEDADVDPVEALSGR